MVLGYVLYANARGTGQYDVVHDALVDEGCRHARRRRPVRVAKQGHVSVPRTVLTGGVHAVKETRKTTSSLLRIFGCYSLRLNLRSVVSQILHHGNCFTRFDLSQGFIPHKPGTVIIIIQRFLNIRMEARHNHTHVIGLIHIALGDNRLDIAPGSVEAQQLARNAIAFLPSLRIV